MASSRFYWKVPILRGVDGVKSRLDIVIMASSPCSVFVPGKYTVQLKSVKASTKKASHVSSASAPPPKPPLIATPCEEGEYPTLLLLHGFMLYNTFYSELIQHIASHGFIVVVPQLYLVAACDSTDDIKSAAKTTDWLKDGLQDVLPTKVRPDLQKLRLSGHSRGGKDAFALALGYAKTTLSFSALIGIDPVDGVRKGHQTNPPVLNYIPHSLELKMPSLVIGTGLGELKRNLFACAPKGVNHQDFYDECSSPSCHFVAKDYGHLDMLNDHTDGPRGIVSYCMCRNGESRTPMRLFVGGIVVAFLKACLKGDKQDLRALKDNPENSNIDLSIVNFYDPDGTLTKHFDGGLAHHITQSKKAINIDISMRRRTTDDCLQI